MPKSKKQAHDYLHEQYLARHDSPTQQKFRRIRPWPVGCVFIEHPEMSKDDIREHFRTMVRLGFTALKQCQVRPETNAAEIKHMAIDEGLCPWWYGEGGWEDPTPGKLEELGIDPKISIEDLRSNDKWIERQKQVWHERVDREAAGEAGKALQKQGDAAPNFKRGADWVPSVQPTFHFEIDEDQKPLFMDWLKRTYGDIETLNDAWNQHHCMVPGPKNKQKSSDGQGGAGKPGWESWEHLEEEVIDVVNGNFREYRRTRDVYRFKADNYINWLRDRVDAQIAADPHAPVRAGGEMGLFLPFASRGTDMEGIADLMTDRGSFYPSFHLSWHFEEVEFETPRTFYMQSTLTTDWFKGGWNATWESTGGPQQMTGHKAPFVPKVRDKVPGFTVDGGVQRQLMLSWIAGGYRGFGLWAWSIRTFGWEGGEYGLISRNNEVTDRAIAAGKIGQACRRLRDELWAARKEPEVGIFQDWDMEAIWAAASRGGRDLFKSQPIRARIGAGRCLINRNIPWEHVTKDDLRAGLGPRYKTIMLPAALALDEALLENVLIPFVEQGGRVVLDAPSGWYNMYGRVMRSWEGSAFEKLFGCKLQDFQYSREGNRPWLIDGWKVEGCTYDIEVTSAQIVEHFDHSREGHVRPAVTRNKLGDGEAIVLGWEATLMCSEPGNNAAEAALAQHAFDNVESPFECEDAIVYRLVGDKADHYFLINDQSEDIRVELEVRDTKYKSAEDPVSQEELKVGKKILVEGCSGRWVRMSK